MKRQVWWLFVLVALITLVFGPVAMVFAQQAPIPDESAVRATSTPRPTGEPDDGPPTEPYYPDETWGMADPYGPEANDGPPTEPWYPPEEGDGPPPDPSVWVMEEGDGPPLEPSDWAREENDGPPTEPTPEETNTPVPTATATASPTPTPTPTPTARGSGTNPATPLVSLAPPTATPTLTPSPRRTGNAGAMNSANTLRRPEAKLVDHGNFQVLVVAIRKVQRPLGGPEIWVQVKVRAKGAETLFRQTAAGYVLTGDKLGGGSKPGLSLQAGPILWVGYQPLDPLAFDFAGLVPQAPRPTPAPAKPGLRPVLRPLPVRFVEGYIVFKAKDARDMSVKDLAAVRDLSLSFDGKTTKLTAKDLPIYAASFTKPVPAISLATMPQVLVGNGLTVGIRMVTYMPGSKGFVRLDLSVRNYGKTKSVWSEKAKAYQVDMVVRSADGKTQTVNVTGDSLAWSDPWADSNRRGSPRTLAPGEVVHGAVALSLPPGTSLLKVTAVKVMVAGKLATVPGALLQIRQPGR